jgi:hypothetical protein
MRDDRRNRGEGKGGSDGGDGGKCDNASGRSSRVLGT